MEKYLDMSIIIPTRNRLKGINECINALNNSIYKPKEVIIIDQSDESMSYKDIIDNVLDIKLITQKEPSLTKARNNGISIAKYDIIVFMDDDTLLDEYSLVKLNNTFLLDKNIKLVTSIDINENKVNNYSDILGKIFLRKKNIKSKGYVCKGAMLGRYPRNCNNIVETQWAMGYFFAVKKSIIEKNNLKFDENLISYAYAEDLDFTYNYCCTIANEGGVGVINPNIYVNHLGSKEWRVESEKSINMYVINRLYLSYKYFKSPIYRLIMIWADTGEVIRRFIKRENFTWIINAYIIAFKERQYLKDKFISDNLLELIK